MVRRLLPRWFPEAPRVVLALAWLATAGAGMKLLLDHQSRAGEPAQAPAAWPGESRLGPSPDIPRLVVFLHPRCPCSRATLSELSRLMARRRAPVDAVAVFIIPDELVASWGQTDLWREARRIPGLRVVLDPGGVESRRFGPVTSGQVLYYGAEGRLAFAGGITPGRGHAGDNAGEATVLALLEGSSTRAIAATPVFGCALWSPQPKQEGARTRWQD